MVNLVRTHSITEFMDLSSYVYLFRTSLKSKIFSIKIVSIFDTVRLVYLKWAEEEGDHFYTRKGSEFSDGSDNTDKVVLTGQAVAKCPVRSGPGILIKLQSDPRPPDLDCRVRGSVFVFPPDLNRYYWWFGFAFYCDNPMNLEIWKFMDFYSSNHSLITFFRIHLYLFWCWGR